MFLFCCCRCSLLLLLVVVIVVLIVVVVVVVVFLIILQDVSVAFFSTVLNKILYKDHCTQYTKKEY